MLIDVVREIKLGDQFSLGSRLGASVGVVQEIKPVEIPEFCEHFQCSPDIGDSIVQSVSLRRLLFLLTQLAYFEMPGLIYGCNALKLPHCHVNYATSTLRMLHAASESFTFTTHNAGVDVLPLRKPA